MKGGLAPPKIPSMNYANMIEEKTLKKGFIIATLISTIIGTFTTGIGLYERVSERRKQKHTDSGQDEKIKSLEKRLDDSEANRNNQSRQNDDGPPRRGGSQSRYGDDYLRNSLQRSGPMIRREYDQDYARLGSRFAEGDLVAQTQLQSQIITLQSTVIKILEEAIYTGQVPDVKRLFNASEFAREGSIRALRDQYQRLLQAAPARRPLGPVRRISSTPALLRERDRGELVAYDHRSTPLFCRYAEDLQRSRMPLDAAFDDPGRAAAASTCPACGAVIPLEPGRAWKIYKEIARAPRRGGPRGEEESVVLDEIPYVLTNRFVVKCHREGVGFSCVLCFRYRDRDTLCETMEDLANHVCRKHDIREYESDPDIKDAGFEQPRRMGTA